MIIKNIIKDLYQSIKKYSRIILGSEVYFPIDKNIKKDFLGNRQARWIVASKLLDQNKIVYSFGVGTDISFDLSLIEKYGCEVFAFDPTPKSIAWIKEQTLPKKLKFLEYGVSDNDEVIIFYPPANANHVSYSTKADDCNQKGIQLPVYRLISIMNNLGHKKIDLLKIDIEGSEYNVIKDLIKSNIDIKQILVEFHHRFNKYSREDTRIAITELKNHGYRIFYISPTGEEYSFIKLDENN